MFLKMLDKMTELKREYVVPLRRKTKFAPKWRRSKKAVSVLNEFIKKHMKTDSVVICKELNEKIWGNGIKNPPGKVSVIAIKTNINGVEKTIVNLQEVGIDKQLELYKSQMPATPAKEEKAEEEQAPLHLADIPGIDLIEEPVQEELPEEAPEEEAPASNTTAWAIGVGVGVLGAGAAATYLSRRRSTK